MPSSPQDDLTSVVTWYDVLGVLPDAPREDIAEAWQARTEALQPGLLAGAPPDVLAAADGARQAVQLTAHPMPVEGLADGQAPAPGEQVHRDSTLTVRVWHPSAPGPAAYSA